MSQVDKSPLMSNYINPIGYLSKVKLIFNKTVRNWLKSIHSTSCLTNLTDEFIAEYNDLVLALEAKNLITTNGDKHINGILVITELSPVFIKWLSPTELSLFNRKRVVTPYPIRLDGQIHECSLVNEGGMEFETYVAIKYLAKKHNALSRGIVWELTLADMKRLLKTKYCKISGVLLTLEGDHHLSLDRVDASMGYTKANTIAVSALVNSLKNDLIESGDSTKGMTNKQRKKMLLSLAELL